MKKSLLLISLICLVSFGLAAQDWEPVMHELMEDTIYAMENFVDMMDNASTESEVEEAVLVFSEVMEDLTIRMEEAEELFPDLPAEPPEEFEVYVERMEEIQPAFFSAMMALAEYEGNEVIMNALSNIGGAF